MRGAGLPLVFALAACGGGDAPSTEARRVTCDVVAHSTTDDPRQLAAAIVEAAATWDHEALCDLVGRRDLPDGLVRYHDAVRDGMPTDVEIVDFRMSPETNTAEVAFEIPEKGGAARLGVALQRQPSGWVVLMAPFLERE